jgi:hypothetical protein
MGSVVEVSLSFPVGQGTMAGQPSNGFFHHTIEPLNNALRDRDSTILKMILACFTI